MEDAEEGKVWKYDYSYWSQQSYKDLIFDFNTICKNIKYVKDKRGNTLKRMDFEEYCWIEGYGCEYYILDGGSYYLSSVEDEEGILIDFSEVTDSYVPMVVDGYSWNVLYSEGDLGDGIDRYYTQKEIIEGDTIINGTIYNKLWRTNPLDFDKKSLAAYIQEDIQEKKIYAYNGKIKVLLYDLDVEVGDTINVLNSLLWFWEIDSTNIQENKYYFSNLVVKNVENINDKVYGLLKKVTYLETSTNSYENTKMIVYERYGSLSGWNTTPYSLIEGASTGNMICAFDEKGEVVFKRKYTISGYGEVKDCYINAEINRNKVDTPKKKENVYYNLQDRTLRVDFEKDERIDIYNTMGKRVMRKKVEVGCKSISCNLNTGVYIVTAKNSNTHTKIVVK